MVAPPIALSHDEMCLKFDEMLSQAGAVIHWRAAVGSTAIIGPIGLLGLAYVGPESFSRLIPTWITALALTLVGMIRASAKLTRDIDEFWVEVEKLSEAHVAVWIDLDALHHGPQIATRRLRIVTDDEIRLDDTAKPTTENVVSWRRRRNRTKLRGKAPQSSSD